MTKLAEQMTQGRKRLKEAILLAESVMKNIEYPSDGAPIGLRLEQAYIQIQKILIILKSLLT